MKHFTRIILLLIVVCIGFYSYGRISSLINGVDITHNNIYPSNANTSAMRVATYNVAHGRGYALGESNWSGYEEGRKSRLVDIGKFLKSQSFDIVVLNEVDFSATWSGNVDQAQIISEAGEFPYLARQINYNLLLPGFSLKFGNAVLSRYPIVSAEREKIPALNPIEYWVFGNHDAIKTKISIGSKNISLWGLHLEVRDEEARLKAVKYILENIDQDTVIAGDLNSRPSLNKERTAYDLLLDSNYFNSFPNGKSSQFTFPTQDPNRILDWILFPKSWSMITGNVWKVDYSDHLPVSVVLKL